MLSLEILNGKSDKQNIKDIPAKPIRPPGKEQLLEKVVVDLQVVGPEHVGLTRKIKNQEIEEVFMSIPGNKLGKYYRTAKGGEEGERGRERERASGKTN